jgi:N-acetylmuramoyl-L-alanine amidase
VSFQTGILEALRDWHLDVVQHDGWQTRGDDFFDPHGHILHHDVVGHTESLPNMMIVGRAASATAEALAGPLCNFWLARSGTVHVVAAGEANHAGDGGFGGLSGNASVWGTEMNNLGVVDDPWPETQLDAMARLAAATAEFSGFSTSTVCGHKEWAPTRKIDPHTIDMAAFRKRVAAQTKEQFSIVDKETKKYFEEKFANVRARDRNIRETQLNQSKRLREIRKAQGASAAELKELDDDLAHITKSLDDD